MIPDLSRIHDAVTAKSNDLVQLTRSLVRFRSENPKLMSDPEEAEAGRRQEEACQDQVASLLGNLGMRVDRWEVLPGRYDVVGTLPGQSSGRSLILNGHVDVVPAGDPAEWSHDPWGGELIEGRIWGRGSVDMKGGLACGIVALEVLRELGIQGDVILQSVVDEETGGPGTRACIERGYRADGAKYLPQERVEDVKQEFEQYIADVARTDPWLRDHPPEIEWGLLGVSFPPAEVPLDHPLVQTLASVHQEVIGKPPVVEGMAAVTDMAWTAQAGIPGLIYGPGDAGVAHGSGEFISLDEMLAGTEATALMLSEWCGAVR